MTASSSVLESRWPRVARVLASITILVICVGAIAERSTAQVSGLRGMIATEIRSEDIPFVITDPGVYFLKNDSNLGVAGADAITIAADDVVLDLACRVLTGVPDSMSGIRVETGRERIVIQNGTIEKFADRGISAASATHLRIIRVTTRDNGEEGIEVGAESSVERCLSLRNGGHGIQVSRASHISDSQSDENARSGFTAIGSSLTRCSASRNEQTGFNVSTSALELCIAVRNVDHGISVTNSTIQRSLAYLNGAGVMQGSGFRMIASKASICSAHSNQSDGFHCFDGSSIDRCVSRGSQFGVRLVGNGNTLRECLVSSATHAVWIEGAENRVDANHFTECSSGVVVSTDSDNRNVVTRNSMIDITVPTFIPGGNHVGPLETAETATTPFSNVVLN